MKYNPTHSFSFHRRLTGSLSAVSLAVALFASGLSGLPAGAQAQDASTDIALISDRLLFVTSGGFWEEVAVVGEETPVEENAETPGENDTAAKPDTTAEAEPDTTAEVKPDAIARRGFYRVVVMRNEDNTSKLFLQQMEIGQQGPTVALTTEIEEINSLGAFVTDLRREDSTGEPGFLAFVLLKTDLKTVEPDTWTILVDEFGDITVEKATN